VESILFRFAHHFVPNLMDMELDHVLGRKRYERAREEDPNHRNGSDDRGFTLKGIGPVGVSVRLFKYFKEIKNV